MGLCKCITWAAIKSNKGLPKEDKNKKQGLAKWDKRVNLGPTPLTCCAKHIRQGDGHEPSKSTNTRKCL